MNVYKDSSGISGIASYKVGDYENGEIFIDVMFKSKNKVYTYEPPNGDIEMLKEAEKLAKAGTGLNGYLKRYMSLVGKKEFKNAKMLWSYSNNFFSYPIWL